MVDQTTTRRRFILSAITFSALAAAGNEFLRFSAAWAQGTPDTDWLARMARILYPHDAIDDAIYEEVIQDILNAAADDPAFGASLSEASAALGPAWYGMDQPSQISALQSIEGSSYFGAIQASVRTRFYSHDKVWEHIGYPGPSVQFGGYVDRGFDDIDWLPEDA